MSPLLVPFGADWDEAVVEERAGLTTVMTAEDGTEQRRAVRRIPQVTLEMTFTGENAKLAALLQSLALRAPGNLVAAPAWPYGHELASPVNLSPTVLVDTTYTPWSRWAMLYEEDGTAELVEIATVGAGQLNLTAPTMFSWPRGAAIVPCYEAWLDPDPAFTWVGRGAVRWRARFALVSDDYPRWSGLVGAAAVNIALGTQPSRQNETPVSIQRALRQFQNPYADRLDSAPYVAKTQLDYEAVLLEPADVAELWNWVDGRLGRLNPSWVPTFSEDLPLAAAIGPTDTSILIENAGYRALHALDASRRVVALIDGIDAYTVRAVLSVIDNGATETLNLEDPAGIAVDPRHGYIGFAHYARLAQDAVRVDWAAPWAGRSRLTFIDLPAGGLSAGVIPEEPEDTVVASVVIPAAVVIDEGSSAIAGASVLNAAGDEIPGKVVAWDSDTPAVATTGADSGDPDHQSLISGVSGGVAIVIASSDGVDSNEMEVTVDDVELSSSDLYSAWKFDSGDKNGGSNGFSLNLSSNPEVVAFPGPVAGDNFCLRHRHTVGNGNMEQRVVHGINLTHFFVGLMVGIDGNFYHRDGPSSDNHKFFRAWVGNMLAGNEGYGDYYIKLGWSTDRTSPVTGDARMRTEYGFANASCVPDGVGQRGTPFTDVVWTANEGVLIWYKVLMEIGLSSAVGVGDGIMRLWVDDVPMANHSNLHLYSRCPGTPHYLNRSYWEGAANQGWNEQTDTYTTRIRYAKTAAQANPLLTTGWV